MLRNVFIGVSLMAAVGCDASSQSITGSATCKLTNTAAYAALYEGPCTVTQSESGANTIFEVKMGSAESFLFAGRKGETNWMTGPDPVQFTDLPDGGIFRWSTFALVVAQ